MKLTINLQPKVDAKAESRWTVDDVVRRLEMLRGLEKTAEVEREIAFLEGLLCRQSS